MVLSELRVAIWLNFQQSAVSGLYLWGFTLPKESHALVFHEGHSTAAVQRLSGIAVCHLVSTPLHTRKAKDRVNICSRQALLCARLAACHVPLVLLSYTHQHYTVKQSNKKTTREFRPASLEFTSESDSTSLV